MKNIYQCEHCDKTGTEQEISKHEEKCKIITPIINKSIYILMFVLFVLFTIHFLKHTP